MDTPTLTQVLRSDRKDSRRYSRFQVLPTVNVSLIELSAEREEIAEPHLAFLRDLSLTGLCYIAPMRHATGAQVSVQVKPGTQTFTLRGYVRRTRRKQVFGRTCYAHGVEFMQCDSVADALPEIAKYLYLAAGLETP